jgi:hypothetical protein
MENALNTNENGNNTNTVLCGVITNCKECKYCKHELYLYGYVCKLSNKFLKDENNITINIPEWCELGNATEDKNMRQNLDNSNEELHISDVIKRYVVKYKVLKPVSYGEEIINATDKWNAYDIFMNTHNYSDVMDVNVL